MEDTNASVVDSVSSSGDKLTKKKWVKFEDDVKNESEQADIPAVLKPESVEVIVDVEPSTPSRNQQQNTNSASSPFTGAILPTESVQININHLASSPSANKTISFNNEINTSQEISLKNVNLHDGTNGASSSQSNIRQRFANGDIIVTLLPVNTSLPWITPAKFRPELVPEELMAQCLTLTVEDYVQIMEILTNDIRFTLYNVCYKRVLVVWVLSAFLLLFALLFSGLQGVVLFSCGIIWLLFNCAAIFLCMWIKIKLNQNLERCMALVNKHLIRHKILLGLDDRGRVSCHKVHLCFIYFDTTECVKKLQEIIEREEASGRVINSTCDRQKSSKQFQERMDIEDQDIIIQGINTTRISRKQERGEQLLTRYIQRWGKDFLRHRLDWNMDEDGGNPMDVRHLTSALCPCQFVEEYLRCKQRLDRRAFCPSFTAFMRERGID